MVSNSAKAKMNEVSALFGGVAGLRGWLMLGLSGFLLGGAYFFHSEWTLWKGLGWGVILLILGGWSADIAAAWRGSLTFRSGVLWVGGMLALSFMLGGLGENEAKSYRNWCWGGAGLVAWWVMLFHVGRDSGRTRMLGWVVVGVAALSAMLSIVHYGFLKPDWHWGRRLSNCLVYGGWNQVCSGVTWAFAAVWALLLGLKGERSKLLKGLAWCAHLVLVFAALASLSRGALLVLLVGQTAALVCVGWKAGAGWALLRFLAVFAFFHAFLPSTVPEADVGGRYPRVIDANPLKEWSRRADTGRFEMYAAVLETMKAGRPRDWLIGDGQWGMNSNWNQSIEERPLHPHSVFFATALHGGLLGLSGLLFVLSSGFIVAFRVARRQADGWAAGLVLSLAGLAGLVFDGHSLASLDSIPRFEPLILWPGLFLAAGRLNGVRSGGKE